MASNRNAGGVYLCEARIGEGGTALVGSPDGSRIAVLGVGGKVINIAISAGRKHYGVCRKGFDLPRDQVARNYPARLAFNDDEVEHLHAREHSDFAEIYLALKGLVGSEQELLPGLSPGIKSTRDLDTTERTIVEQPAVLPGKGNALGDTLIDNVHADLG